MGVEGGLLVGWKGGMGRGKDADQHLRGKGVAEQATGGEYCFLESAAPV